MRRLVVLCFAFPLVLQLGCDPEDPDPPDPPACDAEATRSALASAVSGDVVTIGACTFTGPFDVPDGVRLEGSGVGTTTLISGADGYAVQLMPGTGTPTAVSNLSVTEDGSEGGAVAVFSAGTGTGAVSVEGVAITVTTGVGVAVTGIATASFVDVTTAGPVAPSTGDDPVYALVAPIEPATPVLAGGTECMAITSVCAPDDRGTVPNPSGGPDIDQFCGPCGRWTSVTGTDGIWIEDVHTTSATNLTVQNFARNGLLFVGMDLTDTLDIMTATITDTAGTGLRVDGGTVTLDAVTIYSMYGSPPGARPSVAVDAQAREGISGRIDTTGLQLIENEGFGVLQTIDGTHAGMVAERNGAALWVGGVTEIGVSGSMFADNQLIGVMVSGSSGVSITDTTISGTRIGTMTRDGVEVSMGDGLQIFGSPTTLEVANVTLENNERVGLLFDMGETAVGDIDSCMGGDGACFTDVTVSSVAGQAGAVATDQRVALGGQVWSGTSVGSGLWDMGITRAGAAVDDPTAVTELSLTGAIIPFESPVPTNLRGAIIPFE